MSFHHVAIATRDLAAAHCFYVDAMGFDLVHAQAGVTDAPDPGGWAKHVFYDTGGGGYLALWDLHDPRVGEFDAAVSRGLGLPNWVNHIAFTAADLDDLDRCRDRWVALGHDVLRIDHGRSVSIYTDDPDGNLVEWCCMTAAFTEAEARAAADIVADPAPALEPLPSAIEFFLAEEARNPRR